MADIGSALTLKIAVLGASEADAEIDSVSLSLDKLQASADRTSASVGAGSKLFKAFSSLKTLAAGYGVYKAVQTASSYQAAMLQSHTMAGESFKQVNTQSSWIMGNATKVAQTPTALAEALYHVASAGYRGAASLKVLQAAAKGADVGGANLTDTTKSLTATMLSYGGNAATAMQKLMNIVGSGDMTLENLNKALSTGIMGTAKQLGISFNSLGGALAFLGDRLIQGAPAATRLRMSLMELTKPSSVAVKAMNDIGLSQNELLDDLKKPGSLLTMLKDLKQHLQGFSQDQQTNYLANIFGGGRDSAAILMLMQNITKGTSNLAGKIKDVQRPSQTLSKSFAQWKTTGQAALKQMEALGQVLLIKVGNGLMFILKDGAALIAWFIQGKGAVKFLQVAVAGLAAVWVGKMAAMKLATFIFGDELVGLAAGVGGVGDAMTLMGLAGVAALDGLKAALITTGIGAIIVGISIAAYLLVTHWKQIEKWGVQAFKNVEKWGRSALASIEKAGSAVYKQGLLPIWHTLQDIGKEFEKLFNFARGKGGTISKIFSFLNPVGQASHLISGGKSVVGKIAGFFADGGMTPSAGSYVVGEKGPEIVTLPGGSRVTPNNAITNRDSTLGYAGGVPLGGNFNASEFPLEATIVIQNVMDGKVTAQVVHKQGLMAQSRQAGLNGSRGSLGVGVA